MPQTTLPYFKWTYMDVPGAASMEELRVEFDVLDSIKRGRSVVADFPDDAAFHMDPDNPKDVMLIDNVSNYETIPLVSPVLRDFLVQQDIAQLELLRVSIVDHRGRTAADDYSLVHPCRIVDCIDQKQSVFKWNRLDPTTMSPVSKLVLDTHKLGPDDLLIRPRYIKNLILVREDLAGPLMMEEFRGLWMLHLDELDVTR